MFAGYKYLAAGRLGAIDAAIAKGDEHNAERAALTELLEETLAAYKAKDPRVSAGDLALCHIARIALDFFRNNREDPDYGF